MKINKKISLIIVNYYCSNYLLNTYSSIDHNGNYEVVIVDNSCDDKESEKLRKLKGVKYIENNYNLGYGAANNIGAKLSEGEYLIFINPDCYINDLKFFVYEFIKLLENNDAVIVPKIYRSENLIQNNVYFRYSTLMTFILQLLGAGIIFERIKRNPFPIFKFILYLIKLIPLNFTKEYLHRDSYINNSGLSPSWVSGACFAVSKNIFDNASGFDDSYFLYLEDEDLFRRIKLSGVAFKYANNIQVYHEVGGSQKNVNGFNIVNFYKLQSYLIYVKKYHGKFYFLYSASILISLFIIKLFFKGTLFTHPGRVFDGFKMIFHPKTK